MAPEVALLDQYSQRYPQQRHRSAWGSPGPSGQAEIHSAESMIDRIEPFTGAWNVFQFICNRSDPGSYHVLVEPGVALYLARWSMMTWNIAADSMNAHVTGFSFACRSVDFNPDDWWTQDAMKTMGAVLRGFWNDIGQDVSAANWWASRAQVLAAGKRLACKQHHGDGQPGDRSDAWATHPRRFELDAMLDNAVDNTLIIIGDGDPLPNDPKEDDMSAADVTRLENTIGQWLQEVEARLKTYIDGKMAQQGTVMGIADGRVYEYDNGSIFKRWVRGPAELDMLAMLGVPFVGEIGEVYDNCRELYPPEQLEGMTATLSDINARLAEVQKVRDLSLDEQEQFKLAVEAGLTEPLAS